MGHGTSPATTRAPAILLTLLLATLGKGCTATPSRLLQRGGQQTPIKAYEGAYFLPYAPKIVSVALLGFLAEHAAMVIAADQNHETLAWCERSGLFHPMVREYAPRPKSPATYAMDALSPAHFHGVVYACARLKPHRHGTVVRLHATRRDERPWILEFSNGDYERYVHRSLQARLRWRNAVEALPGRDDSAEWPHNVPHASETNVASSAREDAASSRAPVTYGSLYMTHFGSLRIPAAEEIQAVGQREVYPVPVGVFWEACLDVLSQYDAVAALDGVRHLAVFSHGMSLPRAMGADTAPRYCNALLALVARPRGESGTDLYVAWLPPHTLRPSAIEPLECGTVEELVQEVRERPYRVAAARVTGRLRDHISMQLFWRERWLPKLRARQASAGPTSG